MISLTSATVTTWSSLWSISIRLYSARIPTSSILNPFSFAYVWPNVTSSSLIKIGTSRREVNFLLNSLLEDNRRSKGFLCSSKTIRSSPVSLSIALFNRWTVFSFILPAFSMIRAPPYNFDTISLIFFLFRESPVIIATFPCFNFLCFWIAFTTSTARTVLPEPFRPMISKFPVFDVPCRFVHCLSCSKTSTSCSLIPLTGTK